MANRISITQAQQLVESESATVVDIRDSAAFGQGHIAGATRIDNANVMEFVASADKSKPLLVCCYHGNASQGAADFFSSQGFEQCYSMDGGMSSWALSLPTVSE